MNDIDKWYEFRQQMVTALRNDLMGAVADDVIDEAPLDRFVLGILHPRDDLLMEIEASDVDSGDASGGADNVFDPAVALSRMRYPSSMGLTFAIDVAVTPVIEAAVGAATYTEDEEQKGTWRRTRVGPQVLTVAADTSGTTTQEVADGLQLYSVVRPAVEGVTSVTLVLVNTHSPAPKGRRDAQCWFQPELSAATPSGRFLPRHATSSVGIDDTDLDSYALLFRDVEDLAVGHGCAAEWDEAAASVDRISATFLPWHDVKLAEPAGGADVRLVMSALAQSDDLGQLRGLVKDYRRWISDQERRIVRELPDDLAETARRHLRDAGEAADRITRGIGVLANDPEGAGRAFRLMNAAMELQRRRQDLQRGVTPGIQHWRPFQMAFILMNLEGLTDPGSPDRELADLLWFPTGGGKTEAYLGLIGYCILLRRLRDPGHGGVSVLMRYTLRLLTVQQFERAAGLICALESLRRTKLPNAVPISLGLWVGQGATPNHVKDAKAALRALERGDPSKNGNPRQLLRCPVCGSSLGLKEYRILTGPDRMEVRCSEAACEYSSGLPVHLIDQDVYRMRPSLLIGTVDKFAMMAWRQEVGELFSRDGEHPPPDLIVQDELHLISGPLGTMVGLYEAAVDMACTSEDGHRPKVVASTATIRRAEKQVEAVFDRRSRQFPPPGLDAIDSYFSVEASAKAKGTRRYLGVLAPSVSHATLMVRCYAALLQAAKDIPSDDEVRDAYWTLMGYFNSLRVLGGAFMQVNDDVPDRLKVVAGRAGTVAREVENVGELTSRVDSTDIPYELGVLGSSLPSEATRDVVLATNMISVGLDIDRLGLMAVMGQPQSTAEYIQSTSRVGRKHPGLVVVLYNGARSRDLSHFENFGAYHRALYRQVEATGATPFAARARDRGLHGVLVSIARLMVPGLAADDRAVQLPGHRADLEKLCEEFVARCERIAPQESGRLHKQLDALIENWADACDAPSLKYPGWYNADGALLQDAGEALKQEEAGFPVDIPPWPTMTSLRDVDATSKLFLVPPFVKEH